MVKAMFENYTNVVTTVQTASSLILVGRCSAPSQYASIIHGTFGRDIAKSVIEKLENTNIYTRHFDKDQPHIPFIGRINSTSVAALPPSPTIKASMSDWFHSFVVHIHHRKTILTSWFIGAIARFAMPAHGNNSFGFINRNQRRPERHLQIAYIPLPIILTKLQRCSDCRL